jgi:hypothetical protein
MNRLEMAKHILELRQVGGRLVPAQGLEFFPKIENHRVLVRALDGILRNPFENLDDRLIGTAHDD